MRKQNEDTISWIGCFYYKPLRTFIAVLGILFLLLAPAASASAATLYVGADLGSSGDGTSWATAYDRLEEAMGAASDGDEIWVQGGTYPQNIISISAINNLSIYGGFSGTET